MPHVIVKMLPGRTDEQKARLADAITQALMTTLNSSEASISVGIEDVAQDQWSATVYAPDITAKWETLYKKPGYQPD